MEEEIENELDKVKLKYSDADIEQILKETLSNNTYDWMINGLIHAFKNHYISKIEIENKLNEKI